MFKQVSKTLSISILSLVIAAALPVYGQAQNPVPAPFGQQSAVQPQSPLPQVPGVTDEQVRAWILQNLAQKPTPPAVNPAPAPTPALPTAEQLAQWEEWMQFQKQQVAAQAQDKVQTEAQAADRYRSCIATEKAKLINAANAQQTPASVQNSINSNSVKLAQKTQGFFNLNDWLRQMQVAGIEKTAKKNCKALMPSAAVGGPNP